MTYVFFHFPTFAFHFEILDYLQYFFIFICQQKILNKYFIPIQYDNSENSINVQKYMYSIKFVNTKYI